MYGLKIICSDIIYLCFLLILNTARTQLLRSNFTMDRVQFALDGLQLALAAVGSDVRPSSLADSFNAELLTQIDSIKANNTTPLNSVERRMLNEMGQLLMSLATPGQGGTDNSEGGRVSECQVKWNRAGKEDMVVSNPPGAPTPSPPVDPFGLISETIEESSEERREMQVSDIPTPNLKRKRGKKGDTNSTSLSASRKGSSVSTAAFPSFQAHSSNLQSGKRGSSSSSSLSILSATSLSSSEWSPQHKKATNRDTKSTASSCSQALMAFATSGVLIYPKQTSILLYCNAMETMMYLNKFVFSQGTCWKEPFHSSIVWSS